MLEFNYVSKNGNTRNTKDYFEGIINNLERRYIETKSTWIREWIENYMNEVECPICHGARLRSDVLSVLINKKNIYEATQLSILELKEFINKSLEDKQIDDKIAREMLYVKDIYDEVYGGV